MTRQLHRLLIANLGLVAVLAVSGPSSAGVLSISKNNQIIKDGCVWRGIGVNYFDAFIKTVYIKNDSSYIGGFRVLDSLKIPFARLGFSWADSMQMRKYVTDSVFYYSRMDSVVSAARKYHIGLIPSLIWNILSITKFTREDLSAYKDTNSRAYTYLRKYTREIVRRYRSDQTIWAWEIGNEIYPYGDLPASSSYYSPLATVDVSNLLTNIAQIIRAEDSDRVIISGNQMPTAAQYHRYLYHLDSVLHPQYFYPDTRGQHKKVLEMLNPSPINTISSHIYSFGKGGGNYFQDADPHVNESGYVFELKQIGDELGKPVVIGEFGVFDGDVDSMGVPLDSARQAAYFQNFLSAIVASGIPLSAMWVYNYDYFNPPGQASTPTQQYWTATISNSRAYQLVMVANANQKIRTELLNASGNKLGIGSIERRNNGTLRVYFTDSLIVSGKVLNSRGQMVDDLVVNSNGMFADWGCVNNHGTKVNQGVYYLMLSGQQRVYSKSVFIVNKF